MNEILCFDANGNSIDKLAQWDTNLELYINWEYSVTPIFHFSNTNSKRILVVNGTIDGAVAKANIPNILLQEASPLVVYVYLEKDTPSGYLTGETIYNFKIPVHEKAKPEDYEYFENTEYISWVQLEKLMTQRIDNLVNRGSSVVGEYESALAQIEGIRNNVRDTANEVFDSVTENKKVLYDTEIALANAVEAENNAREQVVEATNQAEIAKQQADATKEDAVEVASNVELAKGYAEQSKKYSEKAKEVSDIADLEERVTELEQASSLNVASIEEIKAFLGI